MSSSTTRFTDRVENYDKYRPTFPPEILIIKQMKLTIIPTNIAEIWEI